MIPDPTPDEFGLEEGEGYGSYCPDCEAIFGPDEDGFDSETCFECGSENVYEVPY